MKIFGTGTCSIALLLESAGELPVTRPILKSGDLTTSLVPRDMGIFSFGQTQSSMNIISHCLEESEMGKNDDHQFGNRFFYLAKQIKRFG